MQKFLILALLAGCATDETLSAYAPYKTYALTEIDGTSTPYAATISFAPHGKVSGKSPCNSYSAQSTVPYPWIQIRNIRGTRRACADLKSEISFLVRLPAMTLAEFSGPVLILSTDNGHTMTFKAQP